LQPGKNPAIVLIYGGAWRTGTPNANEQFSQYMAAQGYTVLAIDYRHAPQYKFPTQIEDIRTGLRFIQQHADEYEVDLDRMAIMGRS
ncbi:MAG: esterase, partial [Leptolyngbya sp. ERB_1_2]